MGLPNVSIIFQSAANSIIKEGTTGTLALVLKDSSVSALTEYRMALPSDMPAGLNQANTKYIRDAFLGSPKEIRAVVLPASATDYTAAMTYLETIKFNLMTIPGIADADVAAVMAWVKAARDTKYRKFMAVLPKAAGDHEGIINFATDNITADDTTYTANQYLARIAGLIAGLPLTVAPTFRVLSEVDDVPHQTKSQTDADIDGGKLTLYHDGEKVKIARGVTSLVTLAGNKTADWQKIKVVRILDLIYSDIKKTIEDNYIGSVQNSYENKLLLIAAINLYFETLELSGFLDKGKNSCSIDMAAQKTYLASIGTDVTKLTDQQIKEANTREKVFLAASVKPLDAIEDVTINITL